MDVSRFKELIVERERIDDHYRYELSIWDERMVAVLSADLGGTIAYLADGCTGIEISWMSEVFAYLFERQASEELILQLRETIAKYPKENEEYFLDEALDRSIIASARQYKYLVIDPELRQRFKLDE